MGISGNLSQGHKSPLPVKQEVRLAPYPVSLFRRREKFFVSAGIRHTERKPINLSLYSIYNADRNMELLKIGSNFEVFFPKLP